MEGFNWLIHEKELDRIFFKDFPLIRRGSEEHRNFWKFFYRYHRFQAQHTKNPSSETTSSQGNDSHGSTDADSLFLFPKHYNKSYRISFSVMTDDLAYKLRQIQQRREDDGRKKSPLTMEHLTEFRTILRHYVNFLQKQKFDRMLKIRRDQSNLPIYQFKEHILSVVKTNQVVLVAGDTGCGKSTQVPQYLLSAGYGKIACTQPRRIACISLAKRVGFETLSEYGTEIAYQVRFEGSKTMATKVLFLTEGLLLRQISTDPDLNWYDVIIVDEVHERHIHGDFLLGVLRQLIDRRTDLKLILMSATINIQLFSEYFQGAPVIRVPGRLFPIALQYKPVSGPQNLMMQFQKSQKLDPKPYLRIMQLIDTEYPSSERGDLLMFVSGMNEIASVLQEARTYAQHTGNWIILPLHSALSIEEQDRVFDVSPDGVRKCVISTNIAETSITIDGIRFVVDSGKVKEMGYDPTSKMSRLQEFWISRASAEQRKGRAGRTGPGVCFRMYNESDYDSFSDYSTPEILRVSLESLVLQTAALGFGNIRKFQFIEPPSLTNIENSITFLKEQGALNSNESLTPIGKMLAKLPVDVTIGKMLIMGTLFHVIDPVLIVAAGLSVQSPFSRTAFGRDESSSQSIRQPLESEHGDPFTLLNAFDEWIEVKSEGVKISSSWCKRRGIEQQRLYEMVKLREQFRDVLQEHGLLEKESREESQGREEGGRGGGREGGSRWSRLSDIQQKELKDMRKRQRTENKRRKILKMDSEGGAKSDSEGEEVSVTADLKHLEFKLLHDLSQLQEGSSTRRTYTLRDINLLKVVICSGLYPQLGIADECNSFRKGSEQVYHSKSKGFVVLHPTSVFSTNPEFLIQEGSETNKKRPELLAYEKLLETNRPYIVNALRVPALQTLLLCSQSIDTDSTCSRFVVDEWLEMHLTDSKSGQEIVSVIQILRSTWISLLEKKLEAKENSRTTTDDSSSKGLRTKGTSRNLTYEIQNMEELLGSRLAEFLDTNYEYSLNQIPSGTRPHLYKGPVTMETEEIKTTDSPSNTTTQSLPIKSLQKKLTPHLYKGGWCITDYLTYDCLVGASEAEAASSVNQHLRHVWVCPHCQETLAVNMAEQLAHQGECELILQQKKEEQTLETSDASKHSVKNLREYFCPECDKVLQVTSMDILRHKQYHKRSNKS